MLLIVSILMLLSLYFLIWNYSFVVAAHLSTMGKGHDFLVEMVMTMIRRTDSKWKLQHGGYGRPDCHMSEDLIEILIITF